MLYLHIYGNIIFLLSFATLVLWSYIFLYIFQMQMCTYTSFYHMHFFLLYIINFRWNIHRILHVRIIYKRWRYWNKDIALIFMCRFYQHFHARVINERRKNFLNKIVYLLYILLFFFLSKRKRVIIASWYVHASISRKQ